MSTTYNAVPYTVVEAACDCGWLALYQGREFARCDTIREAQLAAADDAIASDADWIYDVAIGHGQMVGNVKHMAWFRNAVADQIDVDD